MVNNAYIEEQKVLIGPDKEEIRELEIKKLQTRDDKGRKEYSGWKNQRSYKKYGNVDKLKSHTSNMQERKKDYRAIAARCSVQDRGYNY